MDEAPVSWEGFKDGSASGVASSEYAESNVEGSASGGTSYESAQDSL